MIHKFNKIIGYEINVHQSVTFLYANNEAAKREIKQAIPFIMAPKTRRYLGTNLSKEVKDLYSGNYKTLMSKIEEDTKKWKDIPRSQIRRTNIVTMSILPKVICVFNAVPFNYQNATSRGAWVAQLSI